MGLKDWLTGDMSGARVKIPKGAPTTKGTGAKVKGISGGIPTPKKAHATHNANLKINKAQRAFGEAEARGDRKGMERARKTLKDYGVKPQ